MKKIANDDKLLLVAYASVAIAYAVLFVVKYKHLKE